MISTLDADSGSSSGSGVFDLYGKLVGVTVMTFTSRSHYLSGRTISLPIINFREEIPEDIKSTLCQ